MNEKQTARIIAKVRKWTGRRIDSEAVERVRSGDWTPSHPVDRAILTAIDEEEK